MGWMLEVMRKAKKTKRLLETKNQYVLALLVWLDRVESQIVMHDQAWSKQNHDAWKCGGCRLAKSKLQICTVIWTLWWSIGINEKYVKPEQPSQRHRQTIRTMICGTMTKCCKNRECETVSAASLQKIVARGVEAYFHKNDFIKKRCCH